MSYQVRLYDRQLHPATFHGPRGLLIRVLNWVRWRLELTVEGLALRHVMAEGKVAKRQRNAIMEQFKLDVQQNELEKKTMALRVDVPDVSEQQQVALLSAEKYVEPRKNSGGTPFRPQSIEEMAARYSQPPRQRRYSFGRKTGSRAAEQFEPVIIEESDDSAMQPKV